MAADIRKYLDIIRNANSGESVRDAIINCMRDINAESAIRATNLVITKADNVTHTAPKGFAFKNVTVNIDSEGENDPDKTYIYKELAITNQEDNGEYPPPDEPNTAYNRVIVKIEDDAITTTIADELEMTHTTTDPTSGRKYWEPMLDSEGYTAVKRVWIGTGAGINLPDYPGGSGSTPGTGGSGPFVVTFVNEIGRRIASVEGIQSGNSVWQTDPELNTKLQGNYAESVSGKTFSGWKCSNGGNLDSVISNFTASPDYTYTTGGGTISKSWTEIIANKGADLALGSTKAVISDQITMQNPIPSFSVTSDCSVDEAGNHHTLIFPKITSIPAGKFNLDFMVVAHGEGNTTTTFLSTMPLPYNNFMSSIYNYDTMVTHTPSEIPDWIWPYSAAQNVSTNYGCEDIVGSVYYKSLMRVLYYLLPKELKDAVKTCSTKCQYILTQPNVGRNQIRSTPAAAWTSLGQRGGTNEKCWIPSYGELTSLCSVATKNHTTDGSVYYGEYAWKPESTQSVGYGTVKDYSAAGWVPANSATDYRRICTRSTYIGNSMHGLIDVGGRYININSTQDPSVDIKDRVEFSFGSIQDGGTDRIYFGFCI